MPRPRRIPLHKDHHNPANPPQVGDGSEPSGLLGPTGAPIEEAPRLLGPDGTPVRKKPDEIKPTKAQAEEFIQTLIDVATECMCTFKDIRKGGRGSDCPTCGGHTHMLIRYPVDGDERRYCRPACRERAHQEAA